PTNGNNTTPFHALGVVDSPTVMAQTATIVTPTSQLTGNLLQTPDPPFDWTYEFTTTLPSGVPLALPVRATPAAEAVVVPVQARWRLATVSPVPLGILRQSGSSRGSEGRGSVPELLARTPSSQLLIPSPFAVPARGPCHNSPRHAQDQRERIPENHRS